MMSFWRRTRRVLPGAIAPALALVIGLSAAPASAQDWQAQTSDSGSLLFGNANHGSGLLSFGCTAPSPQGLSLVETESHESHRSEPFHLHIAFDESLFDWSGGQQQRNVTITVGQNGYRLPPFIQDELLGTAVHLPMADPLVAALTGAGQFTLDNGAGTAYQFGTDGLTDALAQGMGYCVDRWAAMGRQTPPSLRPWRSGPTYSARVEGSPNVYDIPPGVGLHIVRLCNGGYTLGENAYQFGNLDGDGLPDYVLNWRDVTCDSTTGLNPHCGAANCSLDVFLSTQNYAQTESFLGTSIGLQPLGNGRSGLRIGGTYSVCGEGGSLCSAPLIWDGQRFSR